MKAEIKEVVTLAKQPSDTHNVFMNVTGCGAWKYFQKYWKDHLSENPLRNWNGPENEYFVNHNVHLIYYQTDDDMMWHYASLRRIVPRMFKRTMNIRLQYSKKVKNEKSKKAQSHS